MEAMRALEKRVRHAEEAHAKLDTLEKMIGDLALKTSALPGKPAIDGIMQEVKNAEKSEDVIKNI